MSTETTSQLPQAKLLIDGVWKGSAEASNTYKVYHSQSLEAVCTAVSASSKDVQEAIASASRAFPLWEATPPSVRRQILIKAADLLDTPTYKARIKEWVCKETAALDVAGNFNAAGAVRNMREAASLASHVRGETVNSETPGVTFMATRRAIGVVSILILSSILHP
jgi:acyl-CoA reductase-like NAD-dependent aldehyde dehydrogenase